MLCESNAIPPQFHDFYQELSTDNILIDDNNNIDPDCDSESESTDESE